MLHLILIRRINRQAMAASTDWHKQNHWGPFPLGAVSRGLAALGMLEGKGRSVGA